MSLRTLIIMRRQCRIVNEKREYKHKLKIIICNKRWLATGQWTAIISIKYICVISVYIRKYKPIYTRISVSMLDSNGRRSLDDLRGWFI